MIASEQQLIEQILLIKHAGRFSKYIDFIQFPFYRNIEIDTRIQFDFPLTVFIGQNGCGKSSCLHALYGAPRNYTPYSFWFDTKVDPVEYYDDQRRRHSFWYRFSDENNIQKEVVKARIKRNNDPNYWETSRPLAWAGMQTRRERNSRDQPIIKPVVYIDFRAELSAFDKFFYFGNTDNLESRNKQEFIRRKSGSLQKLLSGETEFIDTRSGHANSPIHHLTSEELKWVSYILGRAYLGGDYIEHRLYRNNGYSVVFRTSYGKYTEAFAGSGEVAVVRLVMKVLAAQEFSLILLDEPEVSLHPGAQIRLKEFLLDQIKRKKHQVIITSHSPSIVQGLPKEAIKVFYPNPSSGRFLIRENLTPEEAFYHIEFNLDNKRAIIVEDILAQQIIEAVLSEMGEQTKVLFEVKFNPGGESVIKNEFATVFCREENSRQFIIYDGDQLPDQPHIDWRNLPTSDLNETHLRRIIQNQIGEDIRFSVDSGSHNQKVELQKKYLDYYLRNVFYLPNQIPEDIIWDEEKAYQLLEVYINSTDLDNIKQELSLLQTKAKFAKLAEIMFNSSTSENISSVHKTFITLWVDKKNEDFNNLKLVLETILSRG